MKKEVLKITTESADGSTHSDLNEAIFFLVTTEEYLGQVHIFFNFVEYLEISTY